MIPAHNAPEGREGSETMAAINDLVSFVRQYNAANGGKGCPRDVMRLIGGFDAKLIKTAHDSGILVASVGGKGGSWPEGEKPESDNAPATVKARMADALRVIASGGTIAPSVAQDLLAEYDAQNAARKGPRKVVDADSAV